MESYAKEHSEESWKPPVRNAACYKEYISTRTLVNVSIAFLFVDCGAHVCEVNNTNYLISKETTKVNTAKDYSL